MTSERESATAHGDAARSTFTSVAGLAVLAFSGLVLAIAATLSQHGIPATGSGPVRLVVELPDAVKIAILAVFVLTALLVVAVLAPPRRRRRKKDDDFQLVIEMPPMSPWVPLVLAVVLLMPLAVVGYLLWRGWPMLAHRAVPPHLLAVPIGPTAATPPILRPDVSLPAFSGALGLLALAVALGCLIVMLWILFGDRLSPDSTEPAGPPSRPELPALEVVEESLDTIRREPDVRRAIIRCYRRFEEMLSRSGRPRAHWETPTEFMRGALSRLPIPEGAARDLTQAFELARFSQHRLGQAERELAVDALCNIKTALEEPAHAG